MDIIKNVVLFEIDPNLVITLNGKKYLIIKHDQQCLIVKNDELDNRQEKLGYLTTSRLDKSPVLHTARPALLKWPV